VLNNCVDKKDLDSLLDKASGRVNGTVSGGIMHPSLLNKGGSHSRYIDSSEPAAAPAARSTCEPNACPEAAAAQGNKTLAVNFKVMQRSGSQTAPFDKTMLLSHDLNAEGARAEIACACGMGVEGIKLVFAGRILQDDERLDSLPVHSEEVLVVYVVLPKLAGAQA
jgi:hypothetical protein